MASRSIADVRSRIPEGRRVCFVSGKFNVVHPGHLRLFRHAKEICDYLVVAVYPDDWSSEVVLPAVDRLEGVRANVWVNDAILLTEGLEATIITLRPDVVLKGKEHEALNNIEQVPVNSYGGVLRFAGGHLSVSSSFLLSAEEGNVGCISQHAASYLKRHEISNTTLVESIHSLNRIKVLVVGDLIVDRYVDCQPVGLSAEDPSMVVSPLASREFVGGAGMVAAHAAGLGRQATFISVAGKDEEWEFSEKTLQNYGVVSHIFCDSDRPTTLKTRYRAENKTLLRVNRLRDHQIDEHLSSRLTSCILDHLTDVDLLIFSDYSYGILDAPLVERIASYGRAKKLIMVGDSQSSSQVGDITKFHNFSLLAPTEKEARLAVRNKNLGLVGVSQKLHELTGAEHIPITLGSEGVFLHHVGSKTHTSQDDRIPALNKHPVDVSGAGDALLVSTALCLASGSDIWSALYIGSIASACQVSRVGNFPLTANDLVQQLPL